MTADQRVSLRERLSTRPYGEAALIAYLTLGDPVDDFLGCAQSILDAGAMTLELGIPLDAPQEGATLLASHRRARAAGTDESAALALMARIHAANPDVPLIAVNQWPALSSTDALSAFARRSAKAGASALLVVGLPLGHLVPFRAACDDAGVESILSCFPDTPRRMRTMIYRQTTGCLYIARSRSGSGGAGAVNVDDLCREIRDETDLPFIVGFGIEDAVGIVRLCEAGAKAAVVGSALANRISISPAAGTEFIRQLAARRPPD